MRPEFDRTSASDRHNLHRARGLACWMNDTPTFGSRGINRSRYPPHHQKGSEGLLDNG